MRKINLIVIHCSATREDRTFTEQDLEVCHRRRGFNGTGYHFYIRKNGDVKATRPIEKIGAHVRGFNLNSLGICYEGGLDCQGKAKDTRTEAQKQSLKALVGKLLKDYPGQPRLRSSRPEPRSERKRGDRTRRVDQRMPLL